MRRSIGPSPFRGRTFVNSQSNAQDATSAGLSYSVDGCLPWDTGSIWIVPVQFSIIIVILLFYLSYILESNLHSFYSFRGLKYQMQTRIACGLYSLSLSGFLKNDRAAVRAVRTIQYNNLFYLLFIILYNIYNLLFIRLTVITYN